jgi:hypothetical protein
MKTIDRLFEYLEYHKIKPAHFERDLGLSNGYLGTQRKRSSDLGSTIVENIVNFCDDLDLYWLITGKGEMLQANNTFNNNSDMNCNECPYKRMFDKHEDESAWFRAEIDRLNKKLDALQEPEMPQSKQKCA